MNFKNQRRNRYKPMGDRGFRKRNGNGHKTNGNYNTNSEFVRKNPGRNNQNAGKLVSKYTDLAKEALSNGDKVLSENYLQHADHFSRILSSQFVSKTDVEDNIRLESDEETNNLNNTAK